MLPPHRAWVIEANGVDVSEGAVMEMREDIPLMLSLSPSHCQDNLDTLLAYQDFWPACLCAEEGFSNVHFEPFGLVT